MISIIEIETPIWSYWSRINFDAIVFHHDVSEFRRILHPSCIDVITIPVVIEYVMIEIRMIA
jgi:hypothetical protein